MNYLKNYKCMFCGAKKKGLPCYRFFERLLKTGSTACHIYFSRNKQVTVGFWYTFIMRKVNLT